MTSRRELLRLLPVALVAPFARSKEYKGKNNIAKRVQPYPTPEQRYVMVNGGLRRVDERGQIMTRVGKKAAKKAKKLRMRAKSGGAA